MNSYEEELRLSEQYPDGKKPKKTLSGVRLLLLVFGVYSIGVLVLIGVFVHEFGSARTKQSKEEMNVSEIRLVDRGALSFYQGAAQIRVLIEGKTYEVTASDGCLYNYSTGMQNVSTAYAYVSEDRQTETLFLYGPGENEENPFGPIESDRVLLRIVVREGNQITGYALIAFWEKIGTDNCPIFWSGKILKEVSYKKKNRKYPVITLQEVNAALDQAEKEYATEELFRTSHPIAVSE